MTYAQFLLERGDREGGLAAMERARPHQDQQTIPVDKAIAETLFNTGAHDDAIASCQRIVDAGKDTPEAAFRKQWARSHLAMSRFAEAEKALEPIGQAAKADALTLLLLAQCKGGQNDPRAQQELLDLAVRRFPQDPMVFINRAQVLVLKKDKLSDAVADCNKALQLAPDMWQAYRVRAAANDAMGRKEDAVRDLREALRVNPGDDELLRGFIVYLIREGRESDAQEVANQALAQRNDPAAMFNIGQIFVAAERWADAARYLGMAFELDQQDNLAQRYLDALLTAQPPNLGEADRVIKSLGDRVAKNPGFLMAQAKLQMKQGRGGPAGRSALEALKLVSTEDPRLMTAWFNDTKKLVPDAKQLYEFLGDMAQSGVATEWLAYFRSSLLLEDPKTVDQALQTMESLLSQSRNAALRSLAFRITGAALYSHDRFERAAEIMASALTEFPEDSEICNNLAYTLAKKLNKPQDALPLAERALAKRPDSPDVMDTVGLVYLLVGRTQDAIDILNKALPMAQSPQAAVTIAIHLAEAFQASGQNNEAKSALDRAEAILQSNPDTVNDQTKSELQEARRKLGLN
jgi:tetratricopeptide (TPR) repeat protein